MPWSAVERLLMPPAAADLVRYQMGRWPRDLPEGRQRWACQTFRVDDGATGTMMLAAPDHLRHRQFVLGLLRLLLAPSAKGASASAAIDEADRTEIPAWQLARWPSAAAQWISPGLTNSPPPLDAGPQYERHRAYRSQHRYSVGDHAPAISARHHGRRLFVQTSHLFRSSTRRSLEVLSSELSANWTANWAGTLSSPFAGKRLPNGR